MHVGWETAYTCAVQKSKETAESLGAGVIGVYQLPGLFLGCWDMSSYLQDCAASDHLYG